LDDLGFTTTSTVIPKSSSIPVVAFLSFHPFYTNKEYKDLDKQAAALRGFWSSLQVQVAGVHVQQTDLGVPTLKTLLPPAPSIPARKLTTDLSLTIQGTGLTSVTSVLLTPPGGGTAAKANVTAQLQPVSGQSALDNNVDQLVIPAGTELDQGDYEISFLTKDGKTIDTKQKLTVGAASSSPAPASAAPTLTSAVLAPKTTGVKPGPGVEVSLTIQGTNLTQGDTQVVGLGTTPVKLSNVTAGGTTGTVALKLPADYAPGKVHLISAADPTLKSAEIPTTVAP
jgi:hypothetical protein